MIELSSIGLYMNVLKIINTFSMCYNYLYDVPHNMQNNYSIFKPFTFHISEILIIRSSCAIFYRFSLI